MAVDQERVERDAELDRYRNGIVHVERGLAHVRVALAIVGPIREGSTARIARIGRELNAGAAQFKSSLIMAGRSPIEAVAAAAVVPIADPDPVSTVAAVSVQRSVAERRVIVNLSYGDGLAVLTALMDALENGDGGLKRSARLRLERVCDLLEPRVTRARRARRVAP